MAKRDDRSKTESGGFGALRAALEAEGFAGSESQTPTEEKRAKGLADCRVRVRVEKKGRKGKTVTLVEGLEPLDDDTRRALARRLGKTLGCGASVEDQSILLQGDQRARVEKELELVP